MTELLSKLLHYIDISDFISSGMLIRLFPWLSFLLITSFNYSVSSFLVFSDLSIISFNSLLSFNDDYLIYSSSIGNSIFLMAFSYYRLFGLFLL